MKSGAFPPTSRYSDIETVEMRMPGGKTIVYLRRRFLPAVEDLVLLQEHVVGEGDRLDNVTAQYLGDPEQFWRIADANAAMRPWELTKTPGHAIRITLPEGFPGPVDPNA